MKKQTEQSLKEIAQRIREMREIVGFSPAQLAERTEVSEEQYRIYESGKVDLPFSFLHKCALAFGLEGEFSCTVAEALARAREIAPEQDMIFIGGSNFVVAEIA